MNLKDWQTTSFTTNIAESAQAPSERDGIRLSLLAAVQRGRKLDLQFRQLKHAAFKFGVNPRYGNISFAGRKKRAIVRQKAKSARKALKAKTLESSDTQA
jgi:hypothetical protein